MKRVLIAATPKQVGKQVLIAGWVEVRRDHGQLIFLNIRDRSGIVQAVVNPKISAAAHGTAKQLRSEFVAEISGKVNPRPENLINKNLPTGAVEIEVKNLRILAAAQPLPFDLGSELHLDTYLDHQPIALRSNRDRAIFKIQAAIVASFREFLCGEEFVEFQSPKIVAQAAEGGANVFRVQYFKHKAYLAQSPQLYKQIMTGVFERVFTVSNVYRAEPHATTRHLNEYTSLDYEFAFIKDHTDIMILQRDWLEHLINYLAKHCAQEIKTLGLTLPKVPKEIPTWKLAEAQALLKKEFGINAEGAPDLDPEHERLICEYAEKKIGSDFVFITHYPTSKRPFYTYPDERDPETTKSFDLLFRGVEITTGGRRINDYEQLLANIEKWGYKRENFSFYLQSFKYGMPPEGGAATGLERLTQKLCGLENIKQATLFPRDLNRIDLSLSKLKLDDKEK
ncbi:MAG: aspartate--tRNA(Asn) ligase [Candidatus Doudnabacteria bacterium]|nr:aspartate--tRNA(Asn) ligase [Candidatus Doudnabacteria bacterium]